MRTRLTRAPDPTFLMDLPCRTTTTMLPGMSQIPDEHDASRRTASATIVRRWQIPDAAENPEGLVVPDDRTPVVADDLPPLTPSGWRTGGY